MSSKGRRALSDRDFWQASRGFSLVWLAHLGRRHGLFRVMAAHGRPLSPPMLAVRARLAKEPVRLWCEAAAALGLLEEGRGRFRVPPTLVPLLLDDGNPAFLGGHLDYLALRSLDYGGFDELFRDGSASARPQRHLLEAFGEATKWDHTAFLKVLIPRAPDLRRRLESGADVLDVGAGAGAWELRVAPAFPRSRFLGIEPHRTALRLAREHAAVRGLEGTVRFEAGAAETMRFSERFDVVYLGEILCGAEATSLILRNCHRALRKGGHLVVAEGLVDETRPPHDASNALVLAMRLEFALQPADLFTKRALLRFVAQAGFMRARAVPAGGGFFFVVAAK